MPGFVREMDWLPDPDLIQHISLPLEMAGLFFAFVEIFRPKHAEWWEVIFDQFAGNLLGRLGSEVYKEQLQWRGWLTVLSLTFIAAISAALNWWLFSWLAGKGMTFQMYMASAFVIALVGSLLQRHLKRVMLLMFTFMCFFFIFIYALGGAVFLWCWLMARLMGLFNRLGNGRAIGGLGLFLGTLGLTGEVYQVAMLNDDMITRVEYLALIVALTIPFAVIAWFINKVVKKGKTPADAKRVITMGTLRAGTRKKMGL